jgi:arylamine N-acetyltransferase
VIVRYGPKHHPNHEWVYNEADIDGARVVWAREIDLPQTHRLLQYFKDRQTWLADIDIDDIPQMLVPYPISP